LRHAGEGAGAAGPRDRPRDRRAGRAPGARATAQRQADLHRPAVVRRAGRAPHASGLRFARADRAPARRRPGGDCGPRRVRPPPGQRRPGSCGGGACATRRYHVSPVIKPRLDKLLERVDSPCAVVVVSAKRARQINSYYHNLGEGTFDEYPPPMVETGSKNYLKISLEEIAAGKIKYRYRT